jgi:hypothetical protein
MRLFGQAYALEVGGLRLEGSRVIAQAAYRGTGLAETSVRVALPPDRLLGELAGDRVFCRVLAGWAQTGAVEIGRGYVVPDTVDEQQGGDGDSVAFQLVDGLEEVVDRVVAELLPPGVTTVDALRQIARSLAVALDVVEVPAPITYRTPTALAGRAAAVLDELTADAGCRWTLTGGRLRVWPDGGRASKTSIVWADGQQLLAVTTRAGGRGAWSARGWLTPSLRPGDVLRIDHRRGSADVAIDEVVHSIDSAGSTWHTDIRGAAE